MRFEKNKMGWWQQRSTGSPHRFQRKKSSDMTLLECEKVVLSKFIKSMQCKTFWYQ